MYGGADISPFERLIFNKIRHGQIKNTSNQIVGIAIKIRWLLIFLKIFASHAMIISSILYIINKHLPDMLEMTGGH